MNMATKTILGVVAAVTMTLMAAGDVAAHCGGYHGGGGRGVSVQIGGLGGGYGLGGGFGGYGGGYGLGGFGGSVVQTSYYRAPVYRQPAVQVYRAPRVYAPRGGWGRPGCNGGYGGWGW